MITVIIIIILILILIIMLINYADGTAPNLPAFPTAAKIQVFSAQIFHYYKSVLNWDNSEENRLYSINVL